MKSNAVRLEVLGRFLVGQTGGNAAITARMCLHVPVSGVQRDRTQPRTQISSTIMRKYGPWS